MAKSVLLKDVRLSYVHLETPTSFVQGQGFIEDEEKGQYTAIVLIPKGSEAEKALMDTIAEVKSEALAQGVRDTTRKLVKLSEKDMLRYNDGVRDGDTKDMEAYEDHVYINAKAGVKYKPAVYDENNERIPNTKLYSGVYVNAYINVYNYLAATNLGCSHGLVALQFVRDGEPLGGMNVDTDSIFGEKPKDDVSSMFD